MKNKIVNYYQKRYDEQGRLLRDSRKIELVRTQEIILRYLIKSPARILDVGGGAGIYSAWLAKLGYKVHLIDIVPLHIKQTEITSSKQPKHPFTASIGDATKLKEKDESYDAVLLLGPLYHLTEKKGRSMALSEAKRVLKKGGFLFAAAVNRFAALLNGMKSETLSDSEFKELVDSELKDGKHLPKGNKYFTTAYFHRPDELREEITKSGFKLRGLFGIEGPASILPDSELAERWKNKKRRDQLLYTAKAVEQESSLLGANIHLLAIAQK